MAESYGNGVRFKSASVENYTLLTAVFIKYLNKFWNLIGLQNVPDSSEDVQRDANILKAEKLLTQSNYTRKIKIYLNFFHAHEVVSKWSLVLLQSFCMYVCLYFDHKCILNNVTFDSK